MALDNTLSISPSVSVSVSISVSVSVSVSGLYCYPIKGCHGIALTSAQLDERGIEFDRAWMVVNAKTGRFMSQREHSIMALITPTIENIKGEAGYLQVALDKHSPLQIPLELPSDTARKTVTVWSATHEALDAGDEAARWFSEVLSQDCRLVRTPVDYARHVKRGEGFLEDKVGFADGYPLLLTTEASLEALNSLSEFTATMDRFRPNIVVAGEGLKPWQEDKWKQMQVGNVTFRLPKKCARCGVPAVDQTTGEKDGTAILTALAAHRKGALGKVFFGMNILHDQKNGILNVGDAVTVLD